MACAMSVRNKTIIGLKLTQDNINNGYITLLEIRL